jgi:hypothetical protein
MPVTLLQNILGGNLPDVWINGESPLLAQPITKEEIFFAKNGAL